MRLLAIDLGGAHAGWSLHEADLSGAHSILNVGVWELIAHRSQDWGMRWVRLRAALESSLADLRPKVIAYEHVERHVATAAAQVYGAGLGTLRSWAVERGIPCQPIPVSAVKRAATGKGGGPGTDKEAVLAAARTRWPELVFTEDSADSAFAGVAALVELGFPVWVPAPPVKPKRPRGGKKDDAE